MDDWRIFLYPLGFIPNLAFGLRFLLQWLQSEKKGESIVSPLFWQLSILGNGLFMIHAFIQLQYPISVIQGCNLILSWRNLCLCRGDAKMSEKGVLALLASLTLLITLLFYYFGDNQWMRVPQAPWEERGAASVSLSWHILGTIGFALFASRFWIQWWLSERARKSYLPEIFWWSSLLGSLLVLSYSYKIHDSVNLIPAILGMIPYLRNLMILRKSSKAGEAA